MGRKISRVYCCSKGFWKGLPAFKRLVKEARVSEDVAKLWPMKQAIWYIYLLASKHIPKRKLDVLSPNTAYQSEFLFLPLHRHLRVKKVYKYAWTVFDVPSRFKAAEPITLKNSSEVSRVFQEIYK